MTTLPPEIVAVIVSIGIILFSLTVHEAAHAWTADLLGDPTARMLGRISLNPIVHIDPIGTLLLPALAAFSGLPLIGWAKPVPVDLSRLRHGRRDFMIVAAAGPASNILLAIIGATIVRVLGLPTYGESPLLLFVEANVMLAVFNMIPVPPLDGGNVLAGLLPRRAAEAFDRMRPFGFIILYALMFSGMISTLIMPPARFLWSLLIQ